MLKIQVLGRGLIPRGHGIAPKLEPFSADLTLIGTIISTQGLSVNYIHPDTGRPMPLTRENYQNVYKKFKDGNTRANVQPVKAVQQSNVSSKESKQSVVEKIGLSDSVEFKVHKGSEEKVEAPVNEKKDNNDEIKPIINSIEMNKNYNKNDKHNQNGHKK